MTLYLHAILWWKFAFFIPRQYSYNLRTLIIGTPLCLSNWNMTYRRTIWNLLSHAKYLGFIFEKNKIQIACSLNDKQITQQSHICSYMTLLHMPLTLCWVLSSYVTPVERFFMLPRSKLTYMPHITAISTLGIC